MNNEIENIIAVANELLQDGETCGSTGEQIAAAFILNRMEYLPMSHLVVIEAWQRLGVSWQAYVMEIKQDHMHLIKIPAG